MANRCYTLSMPDRLLEIGRKAAECLEEALRQWAGTFGTHMQDAWTDPDMAIQRTVTDVRENLNQRFARRGECSLFIRVPISDRLVLVWSTVPELRPGASPSGSHFADLERNYDHELKLAYYDLCDRLCQARG